MTARPTLPIFPLDICWLVIEELEGDYNALATCSQVCRSWKRRAKSLLNPRDVHLHDRQEAVLAGKRRASQWDGPKHVCIWGSRGSTRGPIPHLQTFAAMMAGRWTRPNLLALISADWRAGDMHADIFRDLATWSKLTYLVLKDVAFPTIATFARLLLSIPNLDSLSCWQVTFARQGFDPHVFPPTILTRLKLSRLVLRKPSAFLLDIAALLCNISPGILDISIGAPRGRHDPQVVDWCMEDIEASGAQSLLHSLGALRRMYGSVISSPSTAPHEPQSECHLDLSHNSKLEEIDLSMKTGHESADFDWFTRSLSSVTSSLLRRIHLELDICSLSDLSEIAAVLEGISHKHCPKLDHLLASPSFQNLQEFSFDLMIPFDHFDSCKLIWPHMLSAGLPVTQKRGILRAYTCAY